MTSNNRFFRSALAAASFVAVIFSPLAASAKMSLSVDARVDANVNAAGSVTFCSLLATHSAEIDAKLAELATRLDARRIAEEKRLTERRTDREKRVADERVEADATFQARMTELQEKALTDAQKKAVADFQAAVAARVRVRTSAVDAANSTYKKGLEDAIAARKRKVEATRLRLIAALRAANAKAEAHCTAGVDTTQVKATLRTSVAAALATYRTDRQAIDQLGEQVKALVAARKAAHAKAVADFKAALSLAKADLRTSFGLSAEGDHDEGPEGGADARE